MTNQLFQRMAQSIIDGDSEVATKLAKQAVVQGKIPLKLSLKAL